MHNEKDGVRAARPLSLYQLIGSSKFPITALREIKLLKMLSHPNILQLREMAVERSKGISILMHFLEDCHADAQKEKDERKQACI